jgi:hypothetical protein
MMSSSVRKQKDGWTSIAIRQVRMNGLKVMGAKDGSHDHRQHQAGGSTPVEEAVVR